MLDPLFVDTGGWIALLYTGDNLHARARRYWDELKAQNRSLITTTAVLTETLDGFAQHNLKYLGALLRKSIESSQIIEVVTIDTGLFESAWKLYRDRGDKQWSLTD